MGDVNGDGIASTADLAALGSVGTNALVYMEQRRRERHRPSNHPDLPQATIASRILGDADGGGHERRPHRRPRTTGPARLRGLQRDGRETDGDDQHLGANTTSARLATSTVTASSMAPIMAHGPPRGQWDRADADGDGIVAQRTDRPVRPGRLDGPGAARRGHRDGLVDSTDMNVAAYLLSSDDAVADIDGSGAVGISDILEIQQGFFGVYADNLPGDVDGNCSVGGEDGPHRGHDGFELGSSRRHGRRGDHDLISTLSNIGTCQ